MVVPIFFSIIPIVEFRASPASARTTKQYVLPKATLGVYGLRRAFIGDGQGIVGILGGSNRVPTEDCRYPEVDSA